MDPKSTTLDPKLKEVYDRVMGTTPGGSAQPAAPAAPQMPNSAPQTQVTPGTISAASTTTHSTPAANVNTAGTPTPAATPPSAFPPPKSSLDASAPAKSAVDYAALAAKYATPPPPLSESQSAAVGAPFTPPAMGGGFVPPAPATPTHSDSAQQATNAATHANTAAKSDPNVATFNATVQVPTNSSVPTTKNSSALLKIALIVGVPLFLIAYTIVWTIVFKVDLMSFIPGA